MDNVILNVIKRTETGKGACKQLRRGGVIPAVIYKEGKPGINVSVNRGDLWQSLHTEAGENAIININIEEGEKVSEKTVIIAETQLDPITDDFLHVDFHEISMKEKLKVSVPIAIKGEAVGVKENNGVLSQIEWELEVECLPTAIPEHIDIHIDDMKIGDSIQIKDIVLTGDVTIQGDPDSVVVSVNPPKLDTEEESESEGEASDEPELIKKGKQEDEDEEGKKEGE